MKCFFLATKIVFTEKFFNQQWKRIFRNNEKLRSNKALATIDEVNFVALLQESWFEQQ